MSYYFASREDLLDSAYRRLARTEQLLFEDALADSAAAPPAAVADVLAAMVAHRLASTPAATLARYELFLEASRRPALRRVLADWREAYLGLVAEVLRRAGSATPDADAPILLDALNGTLLALVAHDETAQAQTRLRSTVERFIDS